MRSAIYCISVWLALCSAACAEKRAFVVGIDSYSNLNGRQLQKARNDAKAIASALKEAGFAVVLGQDLTRSQFTAEWSSFLDTIGEGDEIAFFFAGHGVELGGRNYLIPSDIPAITPGRDEQIARESLSLQEFLSDIRGRKPRFSLLIIDACRENPFERAEFRSSGGRGGLANPEPPEGTFIMYSAGLGSSP